MSEVMPGACPHCAEVAIACSSGGFKGAFVHGVLSAFEEGGLRAGAYAASSSSVFPAAGASINEAASAGPSYWTGALGALRSSGGQMSAVVDWLTSGLVAALKDRLFTPGAARLLVVANSLSPRGLQQVLAQSARRFGRQLLVQAGRGDPTWVRENLALEFFDSRPEGSVRPLTSDNVAAVAQASTRLLHAWDSPAFVDGEAYLDAAYTCACPAMEMAEFGYAHVIAITTAPGVLYQDLFKTREVPPHWAGARIHVVQPDREPTHFGVDVTDATEPGLLALYEHGREKGREFLALVARELTLPGARRLAPEGRA
jgi:hypothetical protein